MPHSISMKHFYKAEKEGTIRKVPTEPYEYTIEATGEIIELSHRWEFVDPALEMEEQVVEESLVI